MTRRARALSPTGIYHVMVRGIGRMKIFHDDRDMVRYLETLERFNREQQYRLYAYCLMNNHVHLLLKEENEPLSLTMKRIGVSYSKYYNLRYERVGHVFQDRFRSEAIKSEAQFVRCARYIHTNPVKAGITACPSQYSWSSYASYITHNCSKLIDPVPLLDYFSDNQGKAVQQLIEYTLQNNTDQFIEWDDNVRVTGSQLKQAVGEILTNNSLTLHSFSCLDINARNKLIKTLKDDIKCTSIELASVLGISRDIIYRVTRSAKREPS
ncbi:MAG: transposase [Firmicutes bacterium]|nr:transposase [Bacillota bacterium]